MRLRRSNLSGPGLRRTRRGKGWSYRDDDGYPVDADTAERIRELVIPPAWKAVWISPYPNGHIQAVGTDDAGRRQYLYHPDWTRNRDRLKHVRVQELVPRLPEFRKAVNRDLRSKGLNRDRVIAVALRMLDLGMFRTGGEEYEHEHGSHGVTTLYREHVTVTRDDHLHFLFPAKSGVEREAEVVDAPLAVAIRALKRSKAPGEHLLQYRDSFGWHVVTGAEVNEAFKALTGADYTVKDLRTWAATVTAAAALAELSAHADPHPSKTVQARTEREVVKLVSQQLGNTPAVARRSYVDPVVLSRYESGTTLANAGRLFNRLNKVDHARILEGRALSPQGRETVERAVLLMLAKH